MKNKVQLITYPDSLGKNLKDLNFVLNHYFKGLFGGIHILPFYDSTSWATGSRGFNPQTYDRVEPIFGNWGHIKRIGRKYDLMVDLIINHLAQQSEYFRDFKRKGDKSKYADMFLTLEKVCPKGKIKPQDMAKIYRPRPTKLLVNVRFRDGDTKKIWRTFDFDRADLDVESPITWQFFKKYFLLFKYNNVKLVRLDSIGYVIKKLGTNCFMIPEVYQFARKITKLARSVGIQAIAEVHGHYQHQIKLARYVNWVYDSSLPMLVPHSIYHQTSTNLKKWLKICPLNQVTTLDTHDGLPLPDVEDLIDHQEILATAQIIKKYNRGANFTRRAVIGHPEKTKIYQVNCTYYFALNRDDNLYLMARAIQFFTPGVPQVYYVGLLAGENDVRLYHRTKRGRDINRHNYSLKGIQRNLRRPVVQKFFKLIKFRNTCPAFNGRFKLMPSNNKALHMRWQKGKSKTELKVDYNKLKFEVKYWEKGKEKILDLT